MGSSMYTVKSTYKCIRRFVEEEIVPMYKKIWRCKVTPLSLVSAWRMLENKIVTKVNLGKRGLKVSCVVFVRWRRILSSLVF